MSSKARSLARAKDSWIRASLPDRVPTRTQRSQRAQVRSLQQSRSFRRSAFCPHLRTTTRRSTITRDLAHTVRPSKFAARAFLAFAVFAFVVAFVPTASGTSGGLYLTSDTTLTEDHYGTIF